MSSEGARTVPRHLPLHTSERFLVRRMGVFPTTHKKRVCDVPNSSVPPRARQEKMEWEIYRRPARASLAPAFSCHPSPHPAFRMLTAVVLHGAGPKILGRLGSNTLRRTTPINIQKSGGFIFFHIGASSLTRTSPHTRHTIASALKKAMRPARRQAPCQMGKKYALCGQFGPLLIG